MNLTKRQKKYIKNNYPKYSIQEIGKSLNINKSAIVEYLQNTGLYRAKSSKKKLQFPHFTLPLILAVLAIIVGIYCFDSKLYVSGDNVEFIDLGKGIADGKGMMGHTKYPFGFPLLLSVTQLLFNQSLLAQKILVLLTYIFGSVFAFFVFKKYTGEYWALFIAFISITNPFVIEFSHYVMSEVPFLFFSFMGIYLFDKYKDKPISSPLFYAAIIGVASAYYIRSIGVTLIGAAVFYYFLTMNWKKGFISGGCFFLLLLPWYIRGQMLGSKSSYFNQFLLKNPYRADLGTIGFSDFISRIVTNLKTYVWLEIPHGIIPIPFRTSMAHNDYFITQNSEFSSILAIITIGIFLAGLIWAFLNRHYFLSVYGIFYLFIVMIWPEVWRGARFIIPAMPLFVFFSVYFFYKLYEIFYDKLNIHLLRGILTSLALLLLLVSINNISHYRDVMENYPPAWANYFKAAEWARDNTPEESVFSDRKPGLFKTVSLRRCTGFAYTDDKKAVINQLYDENVDYVVIPRTGWGQIHSYLIPAVNEYIDRFQPVFFINNPPTHIFKLDRTKGKIE